MNSSQVGLVDTLKIVIALEELTEKLQVIKRKELKQLETNMISKNKIRKIAIIVFSVFTLYTYTSNLFYEGIKVKDFIQLPLHTFVGAIVALAITLLLLAYNQYIKKLNRYKVDKMNFKEEIEYCEINISTLENALKHSIVPSAYQNFHDLELMYSWLQNNIVSNEQQAINKIESE